MLLLLPLLACSKDEPVDSATVADFSAHFSNLDSLDTVSCTLSDGTSTTCYSLTFSGSNPSDDGPYCPATLDDVGGVGIYDGDTNPGFQVMKRALFEGMEADGYDIVDEEGNIRIVTSADTMPEEGKAYCMALDPVDLTLTFLIPVTPVPVSSAHTLETVEQMGVQLDGIPLTSNPPSVVDGPPIANGQGGNIPSIDPCGGHPDPAGYYHAHFGAESMNSVLAAYGMDSELSCTRVAQAADVLIGFAKDGYPIYSAPEAGIPAEADACQGMEATTAEFPDGTYLYYLAPDQAPNLPPCLMGAYVEQGAMTYE